MKNFIIAGFYTHHYKKIMDRYLIPSLLKLNLSTEYIREVSPLGNWRLNTNYKPTFIKKIIEKTKSDILFLDADAVVNSYPILFETLPVEIDLAIHEYNDGDYYEGRTRKELITNTLFFRNNLKIMKLLDTWIGISSKEGAFEQISLEYALKKHPEINVYLLPREYSYIAVLSNGNPPFKPIKNPIISQFQASREQGDSCL